MTEGAIISLFVSISTLALASFVWGILRIFISKHHNPGMRAISSLGLGGYILNTYFAISKPASSERQFTSVIFVTGSILLFWWSVSVVRHQRLSLAFSNDTPTFLLRDGPYRLVRHPFYSSYMLYWVGSLIASNSLMPAAPLAVMAGIYFAAIRVEELKFASSPFATEYEKYRAETGALLPRAWIWSAAR